jgi:hypothetical protein
MLEETKINILQTTNKTIVMSKKKLNMQYDI